MIKVFETINDVPPYVQDTCNLPKALGSLNFYRALEKSQSLSFENGWLAKYVTYFDYNECIGFVPLFSKTKSNDDFTYDQQLATGFELEIQQPYYPKLQVCIPFVPMEGSKLYLDTSSDIDRKNMLIEILNWAREQNHSSIHVTLADPSEYQLLEHVGFASSQQSLCYWQNKSYGGFADFLATLKSKYRSQIQQERKIIRAQGYVSYYVTGADIEPKHVDAFYDLFQSTHDRKGWVRSYLTRDFFYQFSISNPGNLVLMFIEKENQTVATSCLFIEESLLAGRFWGSVTDDHFLHFDAMYYLPIEFCIKNKIQRMEIGFEKPHKVIRGFVPTPVKSFHTFLNSDFNARVSNFIESKSNTHKNVYR